MVIGEVVETSSDILTDAVLKIGRVGLWLQTLGILIVLGIIFQFTSFIFNRKKQKILDSIKTDLYRIEKKIDNLSTKKK